MEEDKAYPNSQRPSLLPGRLQGQALSGQWPGPVGSSVLPLSETEEEEKGAFVTVAMEKELCPKADVRGREPWLLKVRQIEQGEGVTTQGVCPWAAVRHQELQRCEVGVRVRDLGQTCAQQGPGSPEQQRGHRGGSRGSPCPGQRLSWPGQCRGGRAGSCCCCRGRRC